jgi:hypothetical protein
MKDKQLDALIKKAEKQAQSTKGKKPRFTDPTLAATRNEEEADADRKELFKEMKRREF